MIDLTTVEQFLIMIAPSVTSILAILGTAIGILRKFKSLKDSVDEQVDNKELKTQLTIALKENAELKKLLTYEIECKSKVRLQDDMEFKKLQ